jgi:hypothetical protein
MIEFENENDRELWGGHTTEKYFLAMMAEGFTAPQCHWLITCAMLRFQHRAEVQARREALCAVDAVPPGAERAPHAGTRRSRRKKGTTGGLRVIDGDGAVQP